MLSGTWTGVAATLAIFMGSDAVGRDFIPAATTRTTSARAVRPFEQTGDSERLVACSGKPCGDALQPREHARPAIARALMEGLVLLRPKARLLHAHENTALGWRQRPGDDGFQSILRLVAGRVPR